MTEDTDHWEVSTTSVIFILIYYLVLVVEIFLVLV